MFPIINEQFELNGCYNIHPIVREKVDKLSNLQALQLPTVAFQANSPSDLERQVTVWMLNRYCINDEYSARVMMQYLHEEIFEENFNWYWGRGTYRLHGDLRKPFEVSVKSDVQALFDKLQYIRDLTVSTICNHKCSLCLKMMRSSRSQKRYQAIRLKMF